MDLDFTKALISLFENLKRHPTLVVFVVLIVAGSRVSTWPAVICFCIAALLFSGFIVLHYFVPSHKEKRKIDDERVGLAMKLKQLNVSLKAEFALAQERRSR